MSTKLKDELEKAQKDLADLKAEYEEFVYIVSHDLSAPLRQVEGFVELVTSKHADSFDDKTRRHFELINSGVSQAKQLLDAIRGYSRINTRTEPFTALDLNSIIAVVQDDLSPLISKTNALITVGNLPTVMGDMAQVTQVFECLIHNALTYQLPESKPEITLNVVDKVDTWQFCINDNGIGVSENVAAKIFKVLRRGVSDKKYAGMGMGLAIAKKVLQRHQGDIWLDSTLNNGASFYFTIAKDLQNG